MLNVTFFGVRASALAEGHAASRYGRHGPCVALEVPEGDAIVFDLGTGAGRWAATFDTGPPRSAHAFLSRAHPDHLAGLPYVDGAGRLEVLGPPPGHGPDGLRWVAVEAEDLAVGDAEVAVRPVPHAEHVNGYRVEWHGVTVAYVGVHQAPPGLDTVAREVRELASAADLLVHDACLTAAEWATHSTSGHSTVDYALAVARDAGARRLALFGHAPWREDGDLDVVLDEARGAGSGAGVEEVLVAAEGTTVSFERGGP